jgi:hypothetical protein
MPRCFLPSPRLALLNCGQSFSPACRTLLADCLLRTPDSGILDGGSDVDILQMLSDDELAGMNCKDGPHWASCRGLVQLVAGYRPGYLARHAYNGRRHG